MQPSNLLHHSLQQDLYTPLHYLLHASQYVDCLLMSIEEVGGKVVEGVANGIQLLQSFSITVVSDFTDMICHFYQALHSHQQNCSQVTL